MRLPYESWTSTLRKLGLRPKKSCKPVPVHRKSRKSHFEALERRELLAGEITVQYGEGTPVADGGGPVDLGSTVVGEQISLTFTIYNDHEEEDLTIDVGSFDLPAGFTLTQAPDSLIAPLSNSSFTVQLDAQSGDNFSGQLSFDNGDSDESPYNFQISGTVTSLPAEITVKNVEESDIEDGSGSEDFGSTLAGTPVSRSFTIENTGSGSLTIDTGNFSLPSGFTLTTAPAASVSPGGTTTFTVRLDADVADPYAGQISFENGDSDESPFNFDISGTVDPACPRDQPPIRN